MAPISGAPRTCMSRIARAASSRRASRAMTSSCGSRVWSMISTVRAVGGEPDRAHRPAVDLHRAQPVQHPAGDRVEPGEQRRVARARAR